ncbi:MAG: DUF433 domain-containing protein [Candidatus Altiarchaeota archaeon]|nr:DUF433 domain-containing protein [Candidatus Altiarchaeota archaeon]
MEERLRNRIVINPKIMAGKPVIKGTRIPVDAVIQRIADGMSIDEVLKDYPNLEKDDVRAALNYSVDLIRGEYTIPVTV